MVPQILFALCSILEPSDPRLQERSTELSLDEIQLPETQSIIDEMLAIASGERKDLESGAMVGLAAPQVGVMKRIILVDVGVSRAKRELGMLQVFINPQIVSRSEEEIEDYEGCYSVDAHVCGVISRANRIVLQAYDREGKKVESEFSGFVARIVQHEIDHLEAIRFPDRVRDPHKLHWIEPDQYEAYRTQWPTWQTLYPIENWNQVKNLQLTDQ